MTSKEKIQIGEESYPCRELVYKIMIFQYAKEHHNTYLQHRFTYLPETMFRAKLLSSLIYFSHLLFIKEIILVK